MGRCPVMRRVKKPSSANKALPVFLILAIAIMIGWLLVLFKFIFMPMFLAMFATFLLNPPVEWLHRHRLPRPVGIIVVAAMSGVILWLGGKYISASFVAFAEGFPQYEERIGNLIGQAKAITDNFSFITPERLRSSVNSISLAALVGNTLNSFLAALTYIAITMLFLVYFLIAFPKLPERIRQAFPDERGITLRKAIESIGGQVQSYIWAKTLTSVITGIGVALPCMFFGVDFALTWGVFAALLNFVPTIGTFLSVIPPVIICALQPGLGDLSTILWLTGILMVVMALTGNFLEPLILGHSVDISPTASLIALFLFGWLWGVVGMLVAVPAMAVVKFSCDHIETLKPIGALLGN